MFQSVQMYLCLTKICFNIEWLKVMMKTFFVPIRPNVSLSHKNILKFSPSKQITFYNSLQWIWIIQCKNQYLHLFYFQGDSGGPMVVKGKDDRWFLAGIIRSVVFASRVLSMSGFFHTAQVHGRLEINISICIISHW